MTIEIGLTSGAALYRMCLISKLYLANAIWVLTDGKKDMSISMLEYTVYVLMFVHALINIISLFTISPLKCPKFKEQHRCRIFCVGFSDCILELLADQNEMLLRMLCLIREFTERRRLDMLCWDSCSDCDQSKTGLGLSGKN